MELIINILKESIIGGQMMVSVDYLIEKVLYEDKHKKKEARQNKIKRIINENNEND